MDHRRRHSIGRTTLVVATMMLAACSGNGSTAEASKHCPILLRDAELPTSFAPVDSFAGDPALASPDTTRCSATRDGRTWTVSVTDDAIGKAALRRATSDFELHVRLSKKFEFDGVPAAEFTVAKVHTLFFFDGHTYGAVSVSTPDGGTPASRRDLVAAARALLDARDATGSPS